MRLVFAEQVESFALFEPGAGGADHRAVIGLEGGVHREDTFFHGVGALETPDAIGHLVG